jgi:ABC-2 type transport system ATP-binding protein
MSASSTVLLSTHLIEDVSALCAQVVVIEHGATLFAGPTASLSALADGRVWDADRPEAGAVVTWRMGDGRYRHVGEPPLGAELVASAPEHGYLLLTCPSPAEAVAR